MSSISNKNTKSHFHRDSIAFTLAVYCTSYLIFHQFHSGGSIISDINNFGADTNALYLAATILINLGSIVLILYDLISGSSNTIVNIVCSSLEIMGSLCYFIAFCIDIQTISGYEIAYYIGCLIFVSFKAIILSALILSDDSTPKSKVLTKSIVSILTGICMIYYWYNDYNSSWFKPTQIEYGLIMAGWSIIFIISLGIVIYEANGAKNRVVAILFGTLISIGSVLLLVGSILYNVSGDNVRISSEWALSLSVFIASITTAISLGNNSKNKGRKYDSQYDYMMDETVIQV
eukprot:36309_1